MNIAIDKGQGIIVPTENAEIFQMTPKTVNGKEYFRGVFIKWEQNGQTYMLGLSTPSDVRTLEPLDNIKGAPAIPTDTTGSPVFNEAKNGLKLPLGTIVCKANLSNPDMNFILNRYNASNGRWESVKPNFVTDTATGQTRLVVESTSSK
jgi:hypothetical protein